MFFFKNKRKVLEEEIEEKDTFVAALVHDLKNPLIAQSRILESLIKKSSNEFFSENCKQLLVSTRLMLEMIFSVLDTYRYDKGKIKYNFSCVNLLEMTKDVCLELSHLTDDEDLLNIKSVGYPFIYADKMHIRRVISNLISNALKYKCDGSTIVVEIKSDNESLSYSVINEGRFITPKIQKEIFKKYVTGGNKFNSQSTGLGLYLSEKIIKGHKGKMFVKSMPSGINQFGFIIPNVIKKEQSDMISEICN